MKARLHIDGVGFAAPGLPTAEALRGHLEGAPFAPEAEWKPMPASLARRQALRLSEATRVAIMAAEQIAAALPADCPWVFASSTGEGGTLNEILLALRSDPIMIQPLRFQNAVHNAAQGNWSIAAANKGAMTSVAAYDATPGIGFLKAAMQALTDDRPVGLVVFDAPMPPPLHDKRPFGLAMAAAFALSPRRGPESLAALDLAVVADEEATAPSVSGADPRLADNGNPVRMLLPLLRRIHRPEDGAILLDLPGSHALRITVSGCRDG
ncbi:beta-ketoacyl synthase chain length factor [Limibaculum sp. FT325]|uniref:beta-ketoacyl synthase chain length factor n=1 Tax=Thermohalobaculum sediminis TaxID=2939436 RepID=UPI0020BDD246|nr:beta-ketoacyl synthase chain length factor [Limibaculum sediminis]MCL5776421.1 beta-ketoacyl synthase chain length factor [Limibaculum sediminis]